MTVSESDLKAQLQDLDWGTSAPEAAPVADTTPPPVEVEQPEQQGGALDFDVSVPGVKPPRVRKTRQVKRGPVAQDLLDAARGGQTVAANAPTPASGRRSRTAAPDVLVAAGEGPAVIALFDAMWKDVGSRLARSIGRSKASRQDAAIGWYALLLAMRERDAAK